MLPEANNVTVPNVPSLRTSGSALVMKTKVGLPAHTLVAEAEAESVPAMKALKEVE